ncbi:unnamed protein product [Callosobruchus maculatus]|uniref:tRNA-splicing endonuclease subunit Sen54 N-terminal domain-containing protein n=1 Tax=Callosobruchus maculatus TaxID=64391 RepID=A0A653BP89_CALMS|nr:unnamed protein product [Callosobruchus maculatus]
MNELATKLIEDNKSPLMKFENVGSKLFFRCDNESSLKLVDDQVHHLEKLLSHSRVTRRNARGQATWCPEKKVAKVSIVTKGLIQNFGCQNKNGIILLPEEMCFLVEMNRLEVTQNEIPLSIQDCYDIVTENLGFNIYRAYRKLAQHGYRLIRYEDILNKKDQEQYKTETQSRKRKTTTDETGEGCSKKPLTETVNRLQLEVINNIFERIKQAAPSQSSPHESEARDIHYGVFLPNNKCKRGINCDYRLIVCNENLLEQLQSDGPDIIYAVCTDDVSFYQAAKVNIPFCDYI